MIITNKPLSILIRYSSLIILLLFSNYIGHNSHLNKWEVWALGVRIQLCNALKKCFLNKIKKKTKKKNNHRTSFKNVPTGHFPSHVLQGRSVTPDPCTLIRLVHRSKNSMGYTTYVSGGENSMGVSSLQHCFGYCSTPRMSFGTQTEQDACDILATNRLWILGVSCLILQTDNVISSDNNNNWKESVYAGFQRNARKKRTKIKQNQMYSLSK